MIAKLRAALAYMYDARDAVLVYYDELPGTEKGDIAAMLLAAGVGLVIIGALW